MIGAARKYQALTVMPRAMSTMESFADRAYTPDGWLVPRGDPGSVLDDPAAIAARCVAMVVDGTVKDVNGGAVRIHPGSICVHGDTPGAAELASNVRATLEAAAFVVKSLSSPRFGDERSS